MTEDLSGNYEVVLPITLDAAKGPIAEGTVELGHDDAAAFLARGFVREPGDRTAPVVQAQPVDPALTEVRDTPPDPNGEAPNGGTPPNPGEAGGTPPEGGLVEALGEDIAQTLAGEGITTVEQATAATDERLNAIPGVGTKAIKKIQALRRA